MQFECKKEKSITDQQVREVFYFKSATFSCSTDYPLNQCVVADWEAVAEGEDGSYAASDGLTISIKKSNVEFNILASTPSGCVVEASYVLPYSECKNALDDAAVAAAYIDAELD